MAVHDQQFCNLHGGTQDPGGAPLRNANARKHGFYATAPPTQPQLLQHRGSYTLALDAVDLTAEITRLRVLIDDALAAGASLEEISIGMTLLIRAVSAQYRMSRAAKESLSDAISEVLERVGGQMGLSEPLP